MQTRGQFILIHDFMIETLKLQNTELLIYAIIYGFTSDDTTKEFFGSLDYIASRTGTSVRSVTVALKKLRDKGLLSKRIAWSNGRKQCFYHALLPELTVSCPERKYATADCAIGDENNNTLVEGAQKLSSDFEGAQKLNSDFESVQKLSKMEETSIGSEADGRNFHCELPNISTVFGSFASIPMEVLGQTELPKTSKYNKEEYNKEEYNKEIKDRREKRTPPSPPLGGGKGSTQKCCSVEEVKTTNYSKDFCEFYEAYPRKQGKAAAYKSWKKLKKAQVLPSTSTLTRAVEAQKQMPQWRKDNGEFIPLPSTWLNQQRWEDEVTVNRERKPVLSEHGRKFCAGMLQAIEEMKAKNNDKC